MTSTAESESKTFANDSLIIAVAWAQGGREYMQDAFIINLASETQSAALFGVCDGHGPNGENVARYVATRIGTAVLREKGSSEDYPTAIEAACLKLDEQLRKDKAQMNKDGKVLGGSTCCVVWVNESGSEMYSCNVGDSRFVMSYNGEAHAVTEDHKPFNGKERVRIYKAGGHVSNLRVNGILAVSRSFGDFLFKGNESKKQADQLVTALPDIRTVEIDDNIDFMVVASDGLWDIMTNDEAVDFIVNRMRINTPLKDICEQLISYCIAQVPVDTETGLGSDNITIIIALFRGEGASDEGTAAEAPAGAKDGTTAAPSQSTGGIASSAVPPSTGSMAGGGGTNSTAKQS